MAKNPGIAALAAVGLLAVSLLAIDQLFPADIRPAGLRPQTAADEAAARLELAALREVHGARAWEAHRVMEVVFYDDWPLALTRIPLGPWPEARQKIRGKLLVRSWTTELELLDGEDKGERWGLQSWKTWRAEPDANAVFEESWMVATAVAGIRYFLELPLPQDTATFVQDAGPADWEGRTHERLYVTWNRPEPQRHFDQYLLWIDPDSRLVDRVDFTIRALSGLAVATARFEDYDEAGGVRLASRIVIDAVLPTGHTLPVHTIEVESRQWDTFDAADIEPDPELPDVGESKPGD
jgi:hypothetical protein